MGLGPKRSSEWVRLVLHGVLLHSAESAHTGCRNST